MSSILKPLKAWKHLVKKPHTIKYPFQQHLDLLGRLLPTERYRGFHSNDLEKCIGCRMCSRICMNNAITYEELPIEGKGKNIRPKIDYGRCCYCGLCVEVCPTGSLKMTPLYKLVDKDKRKFKFIPTHFVKEKGKFEIDLETVLFSAKEYEEKVRI